MAVTISLAYSTSKMMEEQNLIRVLEACETMGNATNICTDKTGTLTQNRMTVTDAYLGGKQYGEGDVPPSDVSDAFASMLAESICVNSDANLAMSENGTVDHIGSKTECALLQLVEEIRAQAPDHAGGAGGADDDDRDPQMGQQVHKARD